MPGNSTLGIGHMKLTTVSYILIREANDKCAYKFIDIDTV